MFFETLSRFRCPLPVNGSGGQAAANFRPMSEESILRYTDLAALNQTSDIGRQRSAVGARMSGSEDGTRRSVELRKLSWAGSSTRKL